MNLSNLALLIRMSALLLGQTETQADPTMSAVELDELERKRQARARSRRPAAEQVELTSAAEWKRINRREERRSSNKAAKRAAKRKR